MKNIYTFLVISVFSFFARQTSAQCSANFSVIYGIGGNVTFSNVSTGYNPNYTSFYWNFGEPNSAPYNTSQTYHGNHLYGSNGVYTVTLTLLSLNVCTNTSIQTITVSNSPCNLPINANFTYAPGPGGTATLISQCTGTTGGASYFWDFGDQTTGTGPNPVHTFPNTYWYQVTLKVIDGGCTDSISNGIYISNAPCNLNSSFSSSPGISGQYSFASTSTGTNFATTYVWNFGDGNTAFGDPAVNTFSANGVYSVSLVTTNPCDSCNCSSTLVQTFTVNNSPCNLQISANYTFVTGLLGSASFSSLCTGTTIAATYLWKWGDNTTSTGPVNTHNFPNDMTYWVELKVTDGFCVDSVLNYVYIGNAPCTLSTNFSSAQGQAGAYSFTSTGAGTNFFTSYIWDFGNGNFVYGTPTASFNYTANGNYGVALTTTNPSDTTACTSTFSNVISVTNSTCNLTGSFAYSDVGGGAVNFVSTSTGTNLGTTFLWDYPDGGSNVGASATHTFVNGGIHIVTLTVTKDPQCISTVTAAVSVTSVPCTANSNFTLTFSGTPQVWNAIPAYLGNATNVIWSWGDSTYTNAFYPTHTYGMPGVYNICLTVTTSCGTSSTCSGYNIYKMSGQMQVQNMVMINVIPGPAVGIKETKDRSASIIVYPNPASDAIHLKGEGIEAKSGSVRVEVYDIIGSKVMVEEVMSSSGSLDVKLNTVLIPNGTYFIKMLFDQRTYFTKAVISH